MGKKDMGTAESELWSLIEARKKPGADAAVIDAEIWARFGRTWTVMFTDLTGFSRMVAEFGIIHFLQEIHEQRTLFVPVVEEYGGKLLKEEADSMLLLFDSPRRALECAVAMNRRSVKANADRAPQDKVLLCVGIGHGEVLCVGEHDVFGQEVNAASKLGEDTARAGEILVTDAVREHAGEIPGLRFEAITTKVAGSLSNHRVLYDLEAPTQ